MIYVSNITHFMANLEHLLKKSDFSMRNVHTIYINHEISYIISIYF